MKLRWQLLFWIVLAGILLRLMEGDPVDRPLQQELDPILQQNIDRALQLRGEASPAMGGYVQPLTFTDNSLVGRFYEADMQRSITYHYAGTLLWNLGQDLPMTVTAKGVDRQHHFVNAYLEGFQPFRTEQLWVPLYTIAHKLEYQRDHVQYPGSNEIWQSSRQAFYNTRGDCEDHSLVLADWLISMGYDARVVLGDFNGEGHAWVVLFHDGREFLLEATSKRKKMEWSLYPLAGLQTDYHPEYMFNRRFFWTNQGSAYTTRYSGGQWLRQTRYKRR
jgi:hypothetical protein